MHPSTEQTTPTHLLRSELVKLLYQHSRLSLAATLLIAPTLAFILWQDGLALHIGLWLAAMLALTTWRYLLRRRYHLAAPPVDQTPVWERRFLIGVLLAGCLWGSSPFLLLSTPSDPEAWFILLFVLTGMSAGSLNTLSSSRLAYALFVIPTIVPLILRDWLIDPMPGHVPSIMAPVFIAFTLIVSRRTYTFIRGMLELRHQHDALVQKLEQGHTELKAYYQTSIEAEDRANKANILFEKVFATTQVMYALLDRDFNFIQVNRAYAAVNDSEPEDFVGKHHFALFPNEENETIFRRVVETGEPYTVHAKPFEHPTLGTSYWDWSLLPILAGDGQVEGLLLTLLDVTEQQATALALADNEARLRSIMDTAVDAIITTNERGIIESANPAIEPIFGYAPEELVGNSLNMLMPEHHRGHHDRYMQNYLSTGIPKVIGRKLETQGQRRDGTVFPLEVTITDTEFNGHRIMTGIMRDISEQKALLERLEKQNEELRYQSSHDTLTNLMNRRYADDYLAKEWARAQRNGSALSVIIIDVDFFKLYNDNYGHQAGDGCLHRVSHIFESQMQRPSDVIARYGGEEFIAILPETPIEGACGVAELIRQAVADAGIPHAYSSVVDHVTVSIGVSAAVPEQGHRFEEVITLADEALYEAKHQGRNRVVCKPHTTMAAA